MINKFKESIRAKVTITFIVILFISCIISFILMHVSQRSFVKPIIENIIAKYNTDQVHQIHQKSILIMITLIICILIGSILMFFATKRISKPIKYISDITKEVSKGNFDISIKLNPNIDRTYFEKSIILFDIERYEEAIINLHKAIELNTNYEDSYFLIGSCQFELKNYEEGIKYYNKVIELNTNYEDAYYNIGLIKIEQKNYEDAIKYFNKVLELNPNEDGANFNIGYSKINLEKYDEAIENFDKLIEINNKNEDFYYLRAICQYNLKIYYNAIEDYKKVIELNPNYEEAYFLIGICQLYLENENAIEYFRSFFKINKDNNIYIITILQNFDEYYNIEKLFKFIVDIKNNELWENEPITNLISCARVFLYGITICSS